MNHRFNLAIQKKDDNKIILTSMTGTNIHHAFKKVIYISDLKPDDFKYCQLVGDKTSLWYDYVKINPKDEIFDKPLNN